MGDLIVSWLPFLVLLVCPLSMIWMMRKHHEHGGEREEKKDESR